MKLAIAIALTLLLAQPANAQISSPKSQVVDPTPHLVMEHLGDWLPDTLQLSGSAEGLAVYRHRAVMLRHGGQCLILDLRRHRLIDAFQLEGNTSHCNNAAFGRRRLFQPYPLLYVSECFGSKACHVTQLRRGGSTTLRRFIYHSDSFPIAQDWCLEGDQLYAYGGKRGETVYLKRFTLPTQRDTLTDADVQEVIPVSCVQVAQGSKIHKGHAFLLDGSRPGALWLHVVDLRDGREVQRVDLNPIGLEPEGIDIQGRWLYISFHTPNPRNNPIYRFRLY